MKELIDKIHIIHKKPYIFIWLITLLCISQVIEFLLRKSIEYPSIATYIIMCHVICMIVYNFYYWICFTDESTPQKKDLYILTTTSIISIVLYLVEFIGFVVIIASNLIEI